MSNFVFIGHILQSKQYAIYVAPSTWTGEPASGPRIRQPRRI